MDCNHLSCFQGSVSALGYQSGVVLLWLGFSQLWHGSVSLNEPNWYLSCGLAWLCYDWFSSPVGTENRGGSEVGEILTAAHREFGGCAHRCAGKPKCREQD